MKKIALSRYACPDRGNTYTKNVKYSVLLSLDGGNFRFKTLQACQGFLREVSDALTDLLFSLNESYARAFAAWRSLWFYTDNNPGGLDAAGFIESRLNQINSNMDRACRWAGSTSEAFNTCRDLSIVCVDLGAVWGRLSDLSAARSQWADVRRFTLEGAAVAALGDRLGAMVKVKNEK